MKTSNLEKELSEIFEKVYPVIEKKEKTEEARNLMQIIFFRTGRTVEKFVID